MNKSKNFLRNGIGLVLTTAGLLALIGIFSLVIGGMPRGPGNTPSAGQEITSTPPGEYPPPPATESAPVRTEEVLPAPTATLAAGSAVPETPPTPAGRAATLFNGDIWLVEPGVEPQQLTHFGDVSAIFGWNRDGTRLLFGRGRIEQPHGQTTELWVFDVQPGITTQLTSNGLIRSAAWSPTDDRLAFCDYNDILTIITLEGILLNQINQVICGFTWSPDGSMIAVETYTPDMIDSDGLKSTVLGVWRLDGNRLDIFSNAKDELWFWPIWSLDGNQIIFQRVNPHNPELNGFYVININTIEVNRVQMVGSTPPPEYMLAIGASRSPRCDQITFQMGDYVYVMDFEGHFAVIGTGSAPVWLTDGSTVLFRSANIGLQTIPIDAGSFTESNVGGQSTSVDLYSLTQYFFAPGG